MKLKKFTFKVVSLIMVFTILFGLSAQTISALEQAISETGNGTEGFDYVSLGASNTNGYGHLGYLPPEVSEDPLAATKANMNTYGYLRTPENSYPALIAKALEKKYGTVNLHQLAISSMRVEEMRVLLDNDFYGDVYTEWRFTGGQKWFEIAEPGGIKALREAYQNYVKESELITIDMGWNNFGVYAFNNIKTILADGNYWKAPEFETLEGAEKEVKYYNNIKDLAFSYLTSNMGTEMGDAFSESLMDKLDMMADVLAYAAIGACYHFDKSLEKIYELNPNAQVVVINIQNLADDLVINFEGIELKIGDLYGKLIELVDDYRRFSSPYADKYIFANAGDIDTFLDEIVAWDGDPTTLSRDMKDCFDMYDDSLYVRSIVEYLMVGQALSGLFKGFRDMAAGYGLEVFKNDAKYTYEFALTRTTEQLLSLNLGALDLNNPAGDDADVERYGQAVAKHLKNLRGEAPNIAAYDYIFTDLLAGLETQQTTVEGLKVRIVNGLAEIFAGINGAVAASQLGQLGLVTNYTVDGYYQALTGDDSVTVTDATRADFTAKFYADYTAANSLASFKAYLASGDATYGEMIVNMAMSESAITGGLADTATGYKDIADGLAQLDQAINVIVPMAKAEFANKLQGVYDTYHNTLNYAYDVVATFMQYAASINTIEFSADSLNGFNQAANGLIGILVNDFINGSLNKFYYELDKNGVQTTGAPEVPEYVLNESAFDDPALRAIAVLAVRYELGNSFFAHPNVKGNIQITNAVLLALENGRTAKDEADEELSNTLNDAWNWLMDYAQTNYPDMFETYVKVADLIGSKEFKILANQLQIVYNQFMSSTTSEQREILADETYDLLVTLQGIAAKYTNKKLDLNEIDYYVSLGDSTITGYGLEGYIDNMHNGVNQVVAGSAHVLLAQKLFGDNIQTQFANFCQGSLRADDLLLFLGGDVELDDYYYAEIEPNLMEGTLEATQNKYIENVRRADLISVTIGGGNFLTFAGKYVNRVIGTTPGDPYELDWGRIGVDVDGDSMKKLRETIDLLVSVVDAVELMDQYLPEGVEIDDPAKFVYALVEGLVYGYASYTYYYTKVLERVKEINPDAHLVVLGMFNPVDDWKMEANISGEDITVDIGGAVAVLLESANIHPVAFAVQNENTTYVDVSEAETILEAERPGEKLGFNDYYDSSFKSNGKAVHASVAGHQYIADQIYTAITTEYTEADLAKEALLAFVDYVETLRNTFGETVDDAIEMLMQYINDKYGDAFKQAYEDIVRDMIIAELKATLNDIRNSIIDFTTELQGYVVAGDYAAARDLLIEKLNLVESAIYNIIQLLESEVINNEETWKLIATLIETAQSHMPEIIELANELTEYYAGQIEVLVGGQARQRRGGSNVSAQVAELNARINYINNAVNAINGKMEKLASDIYATTVQLATCARNHLIALLQEAYGEFVEAISDAIEYYAPKAINYITTWLYNNPDKVIDFVTEYGSKFVDFIVDNHEVILEALEFVYEEFGDEMLEFVLDNAEYVLPKLVDLVKAYGDDVIDLAKVYINAIYLYVDAQFAVTEKVVAKIGEIAELVAELVDSINGAYDYVMALNIYERIENALADLHAELVANAQSAYAELKAATEAEIAALKAAAEAKIATLRAALVNASAEAKAAIEAEIAEIEAALECAINAKLEALATAEEIAAAAKNAVVEITEQIIDTVSAYVADEVSGNYQANDESLYVSVNGGNAYYAELLAEALDLEPHQIGYTTWDNLDYDLLSKADLITIGYDENELSGFAVSQMLAYVANYLDTDAREMIVNYIEGLFTNLGEDPALVDSYKQMIGSAIDTALGLEIFAGKELEEMDWAQYVGEDNVGYIDEIRGAISNELECLGVPETYSYRIDIVELISTAGLGFVLGVSEDEESAGNDLYEILGDSAYLDIEIPALDAIMTAAESYLYGYVGFNVNYGKLIIDLYELNPEALVVLLGHYNAFDVELTMGDVTVDLSDAYGAIAKISSIHPFVYALLSSKVAYVDIYDAETVYDSYIASGEADGTLVNFLMFYLFDSTVTDPSKAGNEYIFNQILDTLTIGCYHKYDHVCDADCNKCGELREVAGHEYTADCDSHCDKCGTYRIAPDGHTFSDTCDTECDKCGEKRVHGSGHVFDGCEDADCNVCGAIREAGKHAFDHCEDRDCYKCDYVRNPLVHVYDDCMDTKCNVCGMERTVQLHTYTNACDADCNRCGATREVGDHVYDGCEDANCNICDAERTAGKHVFDDCEDGECNVCGQYVVPAGHAFGDWAVTIEATRKNEGEETRVCAQCQAVETRAIAALGGLSIGAIIGIVAGSVTVSGAGGFSIYWFLIQKKTWAQLLAVFGKQAAAAAAEGAAEAAAEGAATAAAEGAATAAAEGAAAAAATEGAAEAVAEATAETPAEAPEAETQSEENN